MIKEIVQLLNLNDYYGESENIQIAKGKYKLPQTLKEAKEQRKR